MGSDSPPPTYSDKPLLTQQPTRKDFAQHWPLIPLRQQCASNPIFVGDTLFGPTVITKSLLRLQGEGILLDPVEDK